MIHVTLMPCPSLSASLYLLSTCPLLPPRPRIENGEHLGLHKQLLGPREQLGRFEPDGGQRAE